MRGSRGPCIVICRHRGYREPALARIPNQNKKKVKNLRLGLCIEQLLITKNLQTGGEGIRSAGGRRGKKQGVMTGREGLVQSHSSTQPPQHPRFENADVPTS